MEVRGLENTNHVNEWKWKSSSWAPVDSTTLCWKLIFSRRKKTGGRHEVNHLGDTNRILDAQWVECIVKTLDDKAQYLATLDAPKFPLACKISLTKLQYYFTEYSYCCTLTYRRNRLGFLSISLHHKLKIKHNWYLQCIICFFAGGLYLLAWISDCMRWT